MTTAATILFEDTVQPAKLQGGPYQFITIDVETAAYDTSSICQIGLAFVGFDGTIETFSTYVDPCVRFADGNTRLHGIDAQIVKGAPTFAQILPPLREMLEAHPLVPAQPL
jgi:DNA polymerase-3 subunit epsilon